MIIKNKISNGVKILGIETSCDETAASIIEGPTFASSFTKVMEDKLGGKIKVLSNVVSSQIEIHKKYGGVVPEVAAREHVLSILPVINEALEKAGVERDDAQKRINAIAVTVGPGLITSLIVGVETARSLSYSWGVPLITVNHIEGHIYANWLLPISIKSKLQITNYKQKKNIEFPALILTVSGGHNMLVLMKGHGKYKIIGETLDDAAGEAFDKAAAMLGIGYPGGPVISAEAEKFQISNFKFQIKSKTQNINSIPVVLPRPMINSKNYNFSFSGLKTAILYKIQKDPNYKKRISDYAHEFQQAVVDVLIFKTIKAAREFKVKTVMLSGGVSANKELRAQMERAVREKLEGVNFHMPDLKYTTDNAAMIATAGYFKARDKKFAAWNKVKADPNLELK